MVINKPVSQSKIHCSSKVAKCVLTLNLIAVFSVALDFHNFGAGKFYAKDSSYCS